VYIRKERFERSEKNPDHRQADDHPPNRTCWQRATLSLPHAANVTKQRV
jgi:hypothetical protein